jgi:hypothetical protein
MRRRKCNTNGCLCRQTFQWMNDRATEPQCRHTLLQRDERCYTITLIEWSLLICQVVSLRTKTIQRDSIKSVLLSLFELRIQNDKPKMLPPVVCYAGGLRRPVDIISVSWSDIITTKLALCPTNNYMEVMEGVAVYADIGWWYREKADVIDRTLPERQVGRHLYGQRNFCWVHSVPECHRRIPSKQMADHSWQ